jgi:isopenicillin N synthase-like dioxygenase
MTVRTAAEVLEEGAETYRTRGKEYGEAYCRVGKALASMFPEGVELVSNEDFTRFFLVTLSTMKLVRYCKSFEKDGQTDAAHDTMVYGAMLVAFDEYVKLKAAK